MRGLVDVSSVIWTCLMAGKDTEYGKEYPNQDGSKMVFVNSADYGYENSINHLITAMDDLKLVPRQLIFVVEGKNSKADRQNLLITYKAGRDKVEQQYTEFNRIKERLLETFLALGAQVVTQDGGVEGDDVLGYLAYSLDGEIWIISGDKDLAQCVGGDIHHYRNQQYDRNPFGDFPHKLVPVCIALVGDPGDKIPGAKGFGAKSFEQLHGVFGNEGLVVLEHLIKTKKLEKLEEDVGELKVLQKVIDDRDGVYLSYELGRLHTERVNTLRRPLQWTAGMVSTKPAEDKRLRKYSGVVRLITKENYSDAFDFFKKHVAHSPEIALDIETSTPEESDEWLERLGKTEDRTPVDVFGSELTGMGITFGRNMQFTYYMTVDHLPEEGYTNLLESDVRHMLELIPKSKEVVVHNAAFELPVCFMSFGKAWASDPLYHGFLPNVIDTRIMSSYVDENRSAKLKSLSTNVLRYEQETYEQVTTRNYEADEWDGTGKVQKSWYLNVDGDSVTPEKSDPDEDGVSHPLTEGLTKWVEVQHKMNELTARHVLGYGADDPICTAAISNHFRIIMEIEETWATFMEVEQFPAYVTAKAFVDGADFSLEEMRAMEKDDDTAYDKAWKTLRAYLMNIGFDGTVCPVYEVLSPANIKEGLKLATGYDLKTMVRTPSKLAKLIQEKCEEGEIQEFSKALLIAQAVATGDLGMFNEIVESNFEGEPQLDLGSPTQMTRLLYDYMGLPVNIINDCTQLEKQNKRELAEAVKRFKRRRAGHAVTLDQDELKLVRTKAKADDTAIDYALAFDTAYTDDQARAALKAVGTMKQVTTRRNLYYKNYWNILHWKDGKIHAQANQCAAVTRRYSMSNPNLQQLPKKGVGVRFRAGFRPHKKDAVICSIDFVAQELRLAAERSQDKNMLACYIGSSLKDIHSITASGAMKLKWGVAAVKEYTETYGGGLATGPDMEYELFIRLRNLNKDNPVKKMADDLRKDSKNINFAAQFGGQAAKLSDTLIMLLEDAQLFLDQRSAMFPGVDEAAVVAEEFCKKHGYALSMMGGRRHLAESINSDDKWASSRAARQAWNFEIQSSAGEMTKMAMGNLWKSGALHKFDVRFIAPIHDELVTSVHRDDALEFIKMKHAAMTGQYANMGNKNDPKSVPILGSISIGPNFAKQIECGDWYIPENITAALNDIFQTEAA